MAQELGIIPPVSGTSRILAYSDAIFSIVGTVMILPITHSEIDVDERLYDTLGDLLPKIAIYGLSFFIVGSIWTSHVNLFELVKQCDDTLTMTNMLIVLVSTFIPYTVTLLSEYPNKMTPNLVFGTCIILIGLAQAFFLRHAFRHPDILKDHLIQHPHLDIIRQLQYLRILVNPAIATLVVIVAPLSGAAFYLLVIMGPSELTKKLLTRVYRAVFKRSLPADLSDCDLDLKDGIPRERVEAFSDGVFAIVATLIILDISEDNVPTSAEVAELGGLDAALAHQWPVFRAYLGIFATVGMLWFCHHSLMHAVTHVSRVMSVCNSFSLCAIGVLPAAFQLIVKYDSRKYRTNEVYAVQMACAVIFLAGAGQVVVFVAALWHPQERVKPLARHGGPSHAYVLLKLCLYPALSFIVYWVSVRTATVSIIAFDLMQIFTPLVFMALRLVATVVPWRLVLRRQQESPIRHQVQDADMVAEGASSLNTSQAI